MKKNIYPSYTAILMQVQTKIQEVLMLLIPYILALTSLERQGMPKNGRKTIGFVKKAYDFAQQNPNLVPPYLEMTVFGMDFANAHGLWIFHNMVLKLGEGIGDTEMVTRSEAYQAAFVFYRFVKMTAT
jgi:hypothetical protein